jgi:hypothetical protein
MSEDPEKPLRTVSFVVHATRGVIRDPNTRRKTMFGVVIASLVLLVAGSTVLQPALDPHQHPGRFISFWIVCGWLALTAILLAVFDFLMLRSEARKAERMLREKLKGTHAPGSPRSPASKQSGPAKPSELNE